VSRENQKKKSGNLLEMRKEENHKQEQQLSLITSIPPLAEIKMVSELKFPSCLPISQTLERIPFSTSQSAWVSQTLSTNEHSLKEVMMEQLAPLLANKSMAILEASLRLALIGIVAYLGIRAVRFGLHKLEVFLLTMREDADKDRMAAEKRVRPSS